MSKKPALHPRNAVGQALKQTAHDILAEVRAALDSSTKPTAVVIHDYRKGQKRWRAFLRLLAPALGEPGERLRIEARDLSRALAGSRDAQSALDALEDIAEDESLREVLSARSVETLTERLEQSKKSMEVRQLNPALRARLIHAVDRAKAAVGEWPVDKLGFLDVADYLTGTYRRARRQCPADWSKAMPEKLHELRARVIEHRYQMELVEPLWPRLARTWVEEAQRLRNRLGQFQDLSVLAGLLAPNQPLARWRSRLSPLIAQRQAEHVENAERIAKRLFAEPPKAFRKRMEGLWEAGGGSNRKGKSRAKGR